MNCNQTYLISPSSRIDSKRVKNVERCILSSPMTDSVDNEKARTLKSFKGSNIYTWDEMVWVLVS